MNNWQIQDVIEQIGIENWGNGYFSIDHHGNVTCSPDGSQKGSISLPSIIEQAKSNALTTPMIIRFPQIIKSQLEKMHTAFISARSEFSYSGKHFGVFLLK